MENEMTYNVNDYKSDQYVRWCPGCGDHAVLNSLQKAIASTNIPPHQLAVISGIGCSSRLPYYMNTYGFHTIHGRGAAIASGVKIANPALQVWLITGDGDCLAIGGNHFIHAVRRNIGLNILLLNNRIYGLTKGQYSPTSARGFKSKSSPQGTVEDPFNPIDLAFGAGCTFYARGIDVDLENTQNIIKAGAKHDGTSVMEVLQSCVIFNKNAYDSLASKKLRTENTITLVDGQKMLYGENNSKGIVLDGLMLKAVTIGENGYTIDDVLVHNSHEENKIIQLQLGNMHLIEGFPLAIGVIRDVKHPVYDEEVDKLIQKEKVKNPIRTLKEYLKTKPHWVVE